MTRPFNRRAALALPLLWASVAKAGEVAFRVDGFVLRLARRGETLDLFAEAPTQGWFAVALGADPTLRAGYRFQMLALADGLHLRDSPILRGQDQPGETGLILSASGGVSQGRASARLRLKVWPEVLASGPLYAHPSWSRSRTLTAAPAWQRTIPFDL